LVCNEQKQCGRECGPTCADGTSGVPCLIEPCSFAHDLCTMQDFTTCSNDYCGGCHALVFNDAGTHEFCSMKSQLEEPKTCTSSSDCGESEYCSNGICTESGSCSNDADCFNPDNLYASIFCVGPISCDMEQGRCARTCDATNCPADQPPVECLVSTCGVITDTCTDEIASCVDYNCGDCSAFVFDQAGFQICQTTEPAVKKACNSTSDCGEWEYCSQGICTEAGKCSSDADCFNPDNIYGVIMCVGPISCNMEEGQCLRTCDATDCPADKPQVQCLVSPCDVISNSCDDEVVKCVDYYCGECSAFAFDAAGHQVCEESAPSTPLISGGYMSCTSAADCGTEEYCAGGECLPFGQCNTVLDCMNPSNIYPVVACVGLLGCHGDGMCGVECGASMCPPGVTPAECLTAPCDSPPSCQEPWEYCINDYCSEDSCGVILLDATGNEITCTPM